MIILKLWNSIARDKGVLDVCSGFIVKRLVCSGLQKNGDLANFRLSRKDPRKRELPF